MDNKPLSTGKKLILILVLACAIAASGIAFGFAYTVTKLSELSGILPVALLCFACMLGSLLVLLGDYQSKNEKTTAWYADKILACCIPMWILMALVMIARGFEQNNDVSTGIGFMFFPLIALLVTPNMIRYALKDMQDWERIFTAKGNLHLCFDNADFYSLTPPLPFEGKICRTIIKEQFLNIVTVMGLGLFAFVCALFHRVFSGFGTADSLIRQIRTDSTAAFLYIVLLFFASPGIPILAYYITNAAYKLHIVRRHAYIACHAVVKSVDGSKMKINHSGTHYSYDYCTCVGIRAKDVHDTKAILVFIPDDVLLFPEQVLHESKQY